jgi:hypothetical protein
MKQIITVSMYDAASCFSMPGGFIYRSPKANKKTIIKICSKLYVTEDQINHFLSTSVMEKESNTRGVFF